MVMHVKKWLQKTLVITVAFLTFGVITPNHQIWDALENGQSSNGGEPTDYRQVSVVQQVDNTITEEARLPEIPSTEEAVDHLLVAAKEQAYIKFGNRIAPIISDEFETRIYPKMQQAIDTTLARLDDDSIRSLSITSNPSGEYAEKIFNIKDTDNGKDIIRFHVRTEKRPKEGYYYNFHYHTVEDEFIAHHNLGDIYWSKNTPPKWLS